MKPALLTIGVILVVNPLTADDVYSYRRHGEWHRPTDDVYRRHLTYLRFSPSVAHSAIARAPGFAALWELFPACLGTSTVQSRHCVPPKRAQTRPSSSRKLQSTSRRSSPWTVRLTGHRKSASRRRQRRLVAYWCLWKWCRVEWKAK